VQEVEITVIFVVSTLTCQFTMKFGFNEDYTALPEANYEPFVVVPDIG